MVVHTQCIAMTDGHYDPSVLTTGHQQLTFFCEAMPRGKTMNHCRKTTLRVELTFLAVYYPWQPKFFFIEIFSRGQFYYIEIQIDVREVTLSKIGYL